MKQAAIEQSAIERAAAALIQARARHRPIIGLAEAFRPTDAASAYAIQEIVSAGLGQRPVGWKIGCTNVRVRALLGAEQPIAGRIWAAGVHASPAVLDPEKFFMRAVEVEFAFRLGAPLGAAEAPFDRAKVGQAVAALHPAIEVVDTRFVDWLKVDVRQLIADNGCHGALILGAAVTDWRDLDLCNHRLSLSINGALVSAGVGANVMGDPLAALAWLAEHLAGRGLGLVAGDIVTTGSACAELGWPAPGDRVEADFGALGRVTLDFQGGTKR